MQIFRLLLWTIFFALNVTLAPGQSIHLRTERGGVSNDGRIKLIWDDAGIGAHYIIQQSTAENFNQAKTIYEGTDGASFISGLKNGTYFYRAKANDGYWSKTLTVKVKHHSLRLALILFGLGALVFLLTVMVVVRGADPKLNPPA